MTYRLGLAGPFDALISQATDLYTVQQQRLAAQAAARAAAAKAASDAATADIARSQAGIVTAQSSASVEKAKQIRNVVVVVAGVALVGLVIVRMRKGRR